MMKKRSAVSLNKPLHDQLRREKPKNATKERDLKEKQNFQLINQAATLIHTWITYFLFFPYT